VRKAKAAASQPESRTPQGLDKPILCNPFLEPDKHWVYDKSGLPHTEDFRRPAGYYWRDPKVQRGQMTLIEDEQFVELTYINQIRNEVRAWRKREWRGATTTTRKLLKHWSQPDRERKLFFCQLEAVETVIWLTEVATQNQRQELLFYRDEEEHISDRTLDQPVDAVSRERGYQALRRYCCKMATGSGKTVVMAMLAAWSVLNKLQNPRSEKHSDAVLIVCPNLTIKERLQVLRPNHPDNYYGKFDLIPPGTMRDLMQQGAFHITNWHAFLPESAHVESGKHYTVVNKGKESEAAFCERADVLESLRGKRSILVFNDEAHHAYRPLPVDEEMLKGRTAEEKATEKQDKEEATVWITGMDRINAGVGILACIDLSATPFYIGGTGHTEGTPLPWIVSDFGLVDAIECGITKIPRVPVLDETGRPEPKYFRLWENILQSLGPGEKASAKRKPKPEAVGREADEALQQLAGLWKETFEEYEKANAQIPPAMIVVCDNTDLAEIVYERISGERVEDDPEKPGKKRVVFDRGRVFPQYLQNDPNMPAEQRPSMRIDTRLLNEAEAHLDGESKADMAQALRRRVNTVGKPGEPGQTVRCVVSVGMLTEGWDACNVTHILGLRAFGSQLLCEQVVGRGLRRVNYDDFDPDTGLLREEYVDVYGIPFEVIPFKKRPITHPPAPPKPITWVHALDERRPFEIHFPRVEGIICDVTEGITVDWEAVEPLEIDRSTAPTQTISRPRVGYQLGGAGVQGVGEIVLQTRAEFYENVRLQEIEYDLAARVTAALADAKEGKLRHSARHLLFPHVLGIVRHFREEKVLHHGTNPKEIGILRYVEMTTQRLVTAIRPLERSGETRLIPRLERYRPIGSTGEVTFNTTRRCQPTFKSHISHVVLDTDTWEGSAAFHLETSPHVLAYARNDHLDFVIPYEFLGQPRTYIPDFLVKLTDGTTLVLEIKGYEDEEDREKHTAARRWVDAVNNWGELGRWEFAVCREPGEVAHPLVASRL
jgi:type III restriction enzyme